MKTETEKNRELTLKDLASVSGGILDGKEETESEDEYRRAIYCHGMEENGPHEWISTGNHEEIPYFIFWSKGYDEYQCVKCGATKWVH